MNETKEIPDYVVYKILVYCLICRLFWGQCIVWFCQTPVLGLRLGVDFTFALDNNNNNNKNSHLIFLERNSF